MKQAVIYARESPSLAENEDTIESQVQAVEERIKEDGNILVDKFLDNGWAGDLLARPELDRLRDELSQNKFDVVYFFDRSRLARKYWLQELVLSEIEEKNKEAIFLKEPKAENDEDKVLQGMKGLFAEYERAKIAERTRRGKLFRAKQGKLVGHEAPYGYKYVRPAGQRERWYEVDSGESKNVEKIFHLVGEEGYSVRRVIKKLYELGIKPRDGKDYWASSTLSKLLRREDYIGNGHYNKSQSVAPKKPVNNGYKRHKKTSRITRDRTDWLLYSVPQIIDKELFDRTQKQLQINQALSPRNVKRTYLLRGLVFCAVCKSRYAGETSRNVKSYRSTLRLRKFPLSVDCRCRIVNGKKLEEKVWNEISSLLGNKHLIKAQFKRYKDKKRKKESFRTKGVSEITEQINGYKEAEKRLIDAYTRKVINLDQLSEKLDLLKLAEYKLEKENAVTPSLSPTILRINPEDLVKKFKVALQNLNEETRYNILHLVVEKISVSRKSISIEGFLPLNYAPDSELRSLNHNCWSSG